MTKALESILRQDLEARGRKRITRAFLSDLAQVVQAVADDNAMSFSEMTRRQFHECISIALASMRKHSR
jgi:hypothetical protein